uniref:Uncharacterized protein n=1 Tax=Candidatus Kentrum sp. UNK TaxID=2126344 RepID=A0A451B204_9GAMM|nr:MAG: hypothetical protein BECKUNK1418G_GA0071005_11141 [Candidatus Kentron sp. UNK]VFK72304.1 MAG: hypothetical protein BECKUNK1418H_GA0071006_11071 [Candidatus Kentron sp. UNK]
MSSCTEYLPTDFFDEAKIRNYFPIKPNPAKPEPKIFIYNSFRHSRESGNPVINISLNFLIVLSKIFQITD